VELGIITAIVLELAMLGSPQVETATRPPEPAPVVAEVSEAPAVIVSDIRYTAEAGNHVAYHGNGFAGEAYAARSGEFVEPCQAPGPFTVTVRDGDEVVAVVEGVCK